MAIHQKRRNDERRPQYPHQDAERMQQINEMC